MRWLGSFLDGLAHLASPFNQPRRRYEFLEKSDAELLASDWEAVGRDIRRALGEEDA